MNEPFFNTTGLLLTLILGIVAFALWFAKTKIGKNFGPALVVLVLGMISYNVGLVPASHEVYNSIVSYCVPAAIAIIMLNVDMNSLKKLSGQPLLAIGSAVFSVCLATFLCGIIFAGRIEEGWKMAGMFVGTYTGGSPNLTAIAAGLDASSDTIAAANAADSVLLIPTLILLFAAPALLRKWKWFHKVWPYHFDEAELKGTEGDKNQMMLTEKVWSIQDIAILLAMGFGINEIALFIAQTIFPASFVSPGKMLLITTISLALAQLSWVKKLRGKLDVGILPTLMFLCIIGFMVDLKAFWNSTLLIALFCACVLVLCTTLHLLITRLFKIKYEYVVLSISAEVCDGATAALVAGGGGWNTLISVSLIMGTLGGLLGNYCGIGIAYLVRSVLGL